MAGYNLIALHGTGLFWTLPLEDGSLKFFKNSYYLKQWYFTLVCEASL